MSLIVLAAGGTGGHVFPAMALARELTQRGHDVRLLTDSRGLKYATDFDPDAITVISAGGLVSGAPHTRILGLGKLAQGYFQARNHLSKLKPAAVVGFGGFPSAPPMLAAQHLGVPTVLHEQNGILGRANEFVSRNVRQISAAFPAIEGVPEAAKSKLKAVGNPIRTEIAEIGEVPYVAPTDGVNVLVVGGSQGAAVFARLMPTALEQLSNEQRRKVNLTIQIREENHAETVPKLQSLGLKALEVAPFFADMPQRLADNHLIIARSGATTVHELAAAARPAIFVPLAVHKDDQQAKNARLLTDVEAAFLVREGEAAPAQLALHLAQILDNPEQLDAMARAARGAALLGAAEKLADMVLEEIETA